jgi:hypothetical protein
MACALSFLQQYAVSGQKFFESTVTGDDARVHHHTMVTKFASMEWKHPGFQQLKKFKIVMSADKVTYNHTVGP